MSLDPLEAVRTLIFAMPLAILVGAVVAPPDAVAQMVAIAGALLVGLPLTHRYVPVAEFGVRTLGAFFLVVFVVVLAGLWSLAFLSVEGAGIETTARVLVVGGAILVGDVLVLERPNR